MKAFATVVVLAAAVVGHCQAWSFSAYSAPSYTGYKFSASRTGTYALGFTAKSYNWSSSFADGCCVKLCNGSTQVQNWCTTNVVPNVPSPGFNKVAISCGQTERYC